MAKALAAGFFFKFCRSLADPYPMRRHSSERHPFTTDPVPYSPLSQFLESTGPTRFSGFDTFWQGSTAMKQTAICLVVALFWTQRGLGQSAATGQTISFLEGSRPLPKAAVCPDSAGAAVAVASPVP